MGVVRILGIKTILKFCGQQDADNEFSPVGGKQLVNKYLLKSSGLYGACTSICVQTVGNHNTTGVFSGHRE